MDAPKAIEASMWTGKSHNKNTADIPTSSVARLTTRHHSHGGGAGLDAAGPAVGGLCLVQAAQFLLGGAQVGLQHGVVGGGFDGGGERVEEERTGGTEAIR